ncbi:MAG: hypothetical protein K1V81_09180 [Paramuribaculum sp.]|jgi:hypothetical protein|nr:hypothetical protein [Duncaniella sp.]
MKTDNSNFYRDIEYQYLELFRDCALSKEFLPIFQKFDEIIFFRRNMYCVEEPTKKEKVFDYLSEFYETTEDIEYLSIKYLVDEESYILYLMLDGTRYSIWIEANNNLISTLWIKEIFNDTLPNVASDILKAVAQAWESRHWVYIENFLDRYFKFEMYGSEEIFGKHILSKRQFLVWISSRFKRFEYTKDVKFEIKAKTGGILISINNQSRFISMKIVNGKIIEAKETDTPLFYFNKIKLV